MEFDLEQFIVAENQNLFKNSQYGNDDELYESSNFGDGFQTIQNMQKNNVNNDIDKIKSWLINLETKETKLIIDDLDDCIIPEIIKNYDWLLELEIDSQKIKNIQNLPKNLKSLSLFNNSIEDIPNNELPDNLEIINLSRNKIQTLQNIPASVKELDVSHNLLKNCYLLTNTNLKELSIESNLLESIPLLLNGLKRLDISQNKLKNIYNIIDSIEDLEFSVNEITIINKFPKNLKTINAFNNKITFLSDLPDNLEYADFSYNQINILPKLPLNIHRIDFACNNINIINVDLENNLDQLNKDCVIILINNPLEKVSDKIIQDYRFKSNKIIKEAPIIIEENLNNIKLDTYIKIQLKRTIIL